MPTSGRLVSGRLPLSVGGVDESDPGVDESVAGTVESGCGPASTGMMVLFELSSLLQPATKPVAAVRPMAIAARR